MNLTIILLAICHVESSGNHKAVNISDGGSASYGYCQVKIQTARMLGFRGHISDLWFKKEVNREFGLKYLQYQNSRYLSVEEIIAAYNAGSVKRNSRGEFVNKEYVQKVFNELKKENRNYVEVQGW